MLDLNHLQIFERVAALGSFSAAARDMGLPRSNVSRAVAKLEEALGTRLMQRTTREVTLTPAGRALHDRASGIMSDLDAALTYMDGLTGAPSGPLRISAGIGLGINVLGDALPTFLDRYPAIELTLHLESARVDLLAEGIDVALRFGDLADSTLVAQSLGALPRKLVASPAYVSKHGMPDRPGDLMGHRIVDMPTANARPRQWHFDGPDGPAQVSLKASLIVDEVMTLHKLVRGGGGIGIVSAYLCDEDIASARLVEVLPTWTIPPVPLSLIFPSRRELAPSVRAFTEFMREIALNAPWT